MINDDVQDRIPLLKHPQHMLLVANFFDGGAYPIPHLRRLFQVYHLFL
jgi:hypothetical protein